MSLRDVDAGRRAGAWSFRVLPRACRFGDLDAKAERRSHPIGCRIGPSWKALMTDSSDVTRDRRRAERSAWKAIVEAYQKPSVWRASWQLLNTLGSYVVLWYLMGLALTVSWWIAIPLAILAGGLLVRTFIIFHDCGHGSFFKSATANDIWGFISGVLTFTPYYHWRWEHSIHHAPRAISTGAAWATSGR
jgi:hypothetical protein